MQEFRIWYSVSAMVLFRHNMWRFAVSAVRDVFPMGSGVLCSFGGGTSAAAACGVHLDPAFAGSSGSGSGTLGDPCDALADCMAGLCDGVFRFCLLCRWRGSLAAGLAGIFSAAFLLWRMLPLSETEPCLELPCPIDCVAVRISL